MGYPSVKSDLAKALVQKSELNRVLERIPPRLTQTSDAARMIEKIGTINTIPVDNAAIRAIAAQQRQCVNLLDKLASKQFTIPVVPPNFANNQLRIDDVFRQLRDRLAQASELTQAIAPLTELQARADSFRIPKLDFSIFPKLTFPDLSGIDWDAMRQSQIDGVRHLADCGWTTPGWILPAAIHKLRKASKAEIDAYFTKRYLRKNDGELKPLSKKLLASDELEKWKDLLNEIFDCIPRKRYKVCIPALLSILEGFIAESLSKKQGTSKRKVDISKTLKAANWHSDTSITGLMWLSVVVFLEHLFKHSDFETATPTFINRHWILHGRAATDWTASDVLKLVNALATIHWLFE